MLDHAANAGLKRRVVVGPAGRGYDGAAAAKKALDAYPERMRWEAEIARRNRESDRG